MDTPFEDVSDAQLVVLQVLWEHGPRTIRQLTDELYPGGSDAHYATVQKLLDRLKERGHVQRDRSTHAHRFHAITERDAIVGHRLRTLAEKLTGGLMAPLLTHLVRAEALTRQEREQLRSLIDQLDKKTKK